MNDIESLVIKGNSRETATLKIFDICFRVKGAGPSPIDNYRTEIYFAGCDKATSGIPCKYCCNPMIWDRSKAKPLEVDFVLDKILKHGLPYITFVGGEREKG